MVSLDAVESPPVLPLLPALSPKVIGGHEAEVADPAADYDPVAQVTVKGWSDLPEVVAKGTGTKSNEATTTWFGRDWEIDWTTDDNED
jgi:hypothetical protein